ncbi:MAG: nucleotide exchange factor GrpE, partial [Burkholderiaceae bacterium]|nr:nucleotide exchange factor GrpE [Burkholderiaceae bacterium]
MQNPQDPTYAKPDPNAQNTAMSPEEAEAAAAAQTMDPDPAAELAMVKAQNAELAEQYLRAKAEVENMRRR